MERSRTLKKVVLGGPLYLVKEIESESGCVLVLDQVRVQCPIVGVEIEPAAQPLEVLCETEPT